LQPSFEFLASIKLVIILRLDSTLHNFWSPGEFIFSIWKYVLSLADSCIFGFTRFKNLTKLPFDLLFSQGTNCNIFSKALETEFFTHFQCHFSMLFVVIMAQLNTIQSLNFMPVHLYKNTSFFHLQVSDVTTMASFIFVQILFCCFCECESSRCSYRKNVSIKIHARHLLFAKCFWGEISWLSSTNAKFLKKSFYFLSSVVLKFEFYIFLCRVDFTRFYHILLSLLHSI
jgi:hypothetical protein